MEAPAAGPPGRALAPALVPLEPLRRLGAGPPTPGAVGSGGGVRYGGRSLTDSHHSQTAFRFSAALWSLSISTPHVLHILSRCLAPSTKNSLQWWHFCDVQYSSCQPAGKATSARLRLIVMHVAVMTREGGGARGGGVHHAHQGNRPQGSREEGGQAAPTVARRSTGTGQQGPFFAPHTQGHTETGRGTYQVHHTTMFLEVVQNGLGLGWGHATQCTATAEREE